MSDPHQVSINDLVEISEELIEPFFVSTDMYALLVLSLVTVTTYSRKKHRLTAQTRIELAIMFLPELIQSLIKNNTITPEIGKDLVQQCNTRRNELPAILWSYIYVARGLPTKSSNLDIKSKKKKKK